MTRGGFPAGDFDQKPYVSGEADCTTRPLGGGEDYVLLACDGFFDVVGVAEVPALVLSALGEEPSGEGVAQKLVSHAREAGSSDNITVMVVFLRPPRHILAQGGVATAAAPEMHQSSE